MTDFYENAKEHLLNPGGITLDDIHRVFSSINKRDVDYADLFFQSVYTESWMMEESIIKGGSYDIDRGVGVRVLSKDKTGFAYADDITIDAIKEAAKAASTIVSSNGITKVEPFSKITSQSLYLPINPLKTLADNEKVALLQRANQYIRAKDSRVVEVSLSLASEYESMLVMANDGHLAADIRPLVRFNISVMVEKNGMRESGYAGGGGRYGYEIYTDDVIFHYADEALRQALLNLEAIDAPAGKMTVVLGSGWPGVLLHEAVGHGLEGDFHRKAISIYTGCLGQKVASPLCTVVDNGALPNRRGSTNVDDEGTLTQNTVLIENGILKGFMLDKRNARLLNMTSTGNGRRESYSHLPIPRMTNTYLLPGESDPDEIIASVKKGLYAVNFGGGQVDITSGKFVFSASEAYLIEDGKIKAPVKGATLIGSGPEVLNKVSMVGNNLALDSGIGICGKDGQSVPVGVGQPTVKVDELTVGGTITHE